MPEQWYEGMGVDALRRTLADVNGDKKADLVLYYYEFTGVFVGLSTGASFSKAEMWVTGLGQGIIPTQVDTGDFKIADLNGDGKADPVTFDSVFGLWTSNLCR